MSIIRLGLIVPLLLAVACSSSDAGSDDEGGGAGESGMGGTGAHGGTGGPGTGGRKATGGSGNAAGKGTGGRAGMSASTGGSAASGANGVGAASGGPSTTGGTGALAGSASVGTHTNPLSKELIDAFVAAHNAARARTDLDPPPSPALPPVSWDPILADSAYNYLNKCVAPDSQRVEHNKSRSADYQALGGSDKYVGENIYASSGNTVTPADAVTDWMSEQSAYDYETNNMDKAGHYTQIVWRESVRIGCAIVNCPNARFNNTVLCDYAPGGNISGQEPY